MPMSLLPIGTKNQWKLGRVNRLEQIENLNKIDFFNSEKQNIKNWKSKIWIFQPDTVKGVPALLLLDSADELEINKQRAVEEQQVRRNV